MLRFVEDFKNWDCANLMNADSPDHMVDEFEKAVATITDRHFPLTRIRKRSNEWPWITIGIRRLWKRKLRLYKKRGRCQAWWDADARLQQELAEAQEEYVNKMLIQGNAGKSFYAATKKLAEPGGGQKWNVTDLFSNKNPAHVCGEVLAYFGGIGGTTEVTVEAPVISGRTGGLPMFTEEIVSEMLRKSKKTQSQVNGDPLPQLLRQFPRAFAKPVSAIYNKINDTVKWPTKWKTEYLTIIPKVPNPSDLSECRNISCTSILSKILENRVLGQLREELTPNPRQYGGAPKCGAEHLLIELWEEIIGCIEGWGKAAVLLGVDFEKAFNRMDHDVCLAQLEKLGASAGSLALVDSFLRGRRMTFSLDGQCPDAVPLLRGSPQGSVLGCLLYCIATQSLTDVLERGDPEAAVAINFYPQGRSDQASGWERPGSSQDGVILSRGGTLTSFKYIDDTTLFEPASMEDAVRHLTVGPTMECFENLKLGPAFRNLMKRAGETGMKINTKKT